MEQAAFGQNSGKKEEIPMFDVVAVGELLIDFTPFEKEGKTAFEQNAGGAPPNLLAAVSRLGGKGAFIGKVGRDAFGRFLKKTLEDFRIDTSGLLQSDDPTTLAFVHLAPDGERDFSFYRKDTADVKLSPEELPLRLLDQTKLFHFGSLTMTAEPARSATKRLLQYARQRNIPISFDPNLRPSLWDSLETAKEQMLFGLSYADIVKVSEEELFFLTGNKDLEQGSRLLLSRKKEETEAQSRSGQHESDYQDYCEQEGAQLVLVTLGKDGCFYRRGEITGSIPSFAVRAVDATGAGDGFLGGFLYAFLGYDKPLSALSCGELEDAIRFANAVGALAATKRGGMASMPSIEQVCALTPLPCRRA